MARIAVDKRRSRRRAGLFTTENVTLNNKEWKRLSGKRMGPARFVFSWLALLIGLFSCYTAIHYVPSLIGKSELLAVSTRDTASAKLDVDKESFFAPYIKIFDLKRAYMRQGQTIQAQYEMPRGMTIDLHITKCRNAPVLEVYNCEPVGSEVITIRDRSGAREFRVSEAGFYYFDEVIKRGNADADYRIVWRRG